VTSTLSVFVIPIFYCLSFRRLSAAKDGGICFSPATARTTGAPPLRSLQRWDSMNPTIVVEPLCCLSFRPATVCHSDSLLFVIPTEGRNLHFAGSASEEWRYPTPKAMSSRPRAKRGRRDPTTANITTEVTRHSHEDPDQLGCPISRAFARSGAFRNRRDRHPHRRHPEEGKARRGISRGTK
jgi:hypothetical protein